MNTRDYHNRIITCLYHTIIFFPRVVRLGLLVMTGTLIFFLHIYMSIYIYTNIMDISWNIDYQY